MKKVTRKERELAYRLSHKLLCPQCENKSPRQMMIEHMDVIPFLVKSKCSICGYDGMFVEVPIEKVKA